MKRTFALLVLGLAMMAVAPPERSVSAQERAKPTYVEIKREAFQKDVNGKQVDLFTLKNSHGMVVKITNQGGKIVQLLVPDRNNELGDVVLGYDTLDQYMAGRASMGAIIGRYANRIAKGRLILNGQSYQLPINNGPNHLHGGKGTQFLVFDAKQIDARTLQLHYYFKDGEEGYPGNTSLKVVYAVTDDNELRITYEAVTDKPTVVNFTNHAFFNLAGEGRGDILGHELTINADRFTPIDDTSIPTGELRAVKGTPMDFTRPQKIGARINDSDPAAEERHRLRSQLRAQQERAGVELRRAPLRSRLGPGDGGVHDRAGDAGLLRGTFSPARHRWIWGRAASSTASARPSAWRRSISRIAQPGQLPHHRPESRAVVHLDHDLQVLAQASGTGSPALIRPFRRPSPTGPGAPQILPEDEFFLLLRQALQTQHPRHRPVDAHVRRPVGPEHHPVAPTVSITRRRAASLWVRQS